MAVLGRTKEPRAGPLLRKFLPHWYHYPQVPDEPTNWISALILPQSISCSTYLPFLGPSPVCSNTHVSRLFTPLACLTLWSVVHGLLQVPSTPAWQESHQRPPLQQAPRCVHSQQTSPVDVQACDRKELPTLKCVSCN